MLRIKLNDEPLKSRRLVIEDEPHQSLILGCDWRAGAGHEDGRV